MFKGIFSACYDNLRKPIDTLCGQNWGLHYLLFVMMMMMWRWRWWRRRR